MTIYSDQFPSTAGYVKAHRSVTEPDGPVVLVPEIVGVEENVPAIPLRTPVVAQFLPLERAQSGVTKT